MRSLWLLLALTTSAVAQPLIGFGLPLSTQTIQRYAISVYPDGRNLPPGQGSVRAGGELYADRCASCHSANGKQGPAARLVGRDGFFSFDDPLRIMRIGEHPLLLFSVGGQWPYATSIFDYTRRAMPHYAPKSLSDDQVYAITAYILHMNGLLDASAVLDQDSLPKVEMPGRKRLRWAQGAPESAAPAPMP
ncbi:cytochrome c [Pseudomonas sp. MMS21-TM103]|uniref:c-type cytochrome n=1 Tax=Pseudomonas sp. MMS21 TM103 TaxID=2886506 RepID=UPI001EE13A8B|nr:cytochrome c [Pseudomonas sp. MMS21 TM103]MCG4455465.1 cytochrome c [Pseudomonas sp. MMS21 TM103]